ncbi:FecR family protein [Marinagarivorans cellulosilyticus]|uniref:Transmembrane sensor n=1 Tax=Marinagarivorans cellulosilyticus TaxID=2721545 RepID=A0AAN2BIJ7_9GAMM|nr:FecR domain-containing protein [Marinagarivorans cellulosilyticus]BCD95941.1 transmembrane sensor [Marinagarivorans cellulosilyticus]
MLSKWTVWRKWLETPAQKQATAWLIKLNNNSLGQAEHAKFFLWLESSAENQVAYLKAERAWVAGEAIRNYRSTKDDRYSFIRWQWTGALTLCVLFTFAWISINYQNLEVTNTFEAISGYQEILLQDGSQVMLGAGARGRFTLGDNSRTFTLDSGRAYFDVMKDSSSPFIVQSHFGAVKVHGTQFSVELDGNNGVITVLEGKVGVASIQAEKEDILIANQQHSFLGQQQGIPVKSIDAKALLAWRKGKLVFNGNSLVNATSQLEDALNAVITVDNSVLDVSIVGVVSLDSPQAAVSAIADIANLKWREMANNNFLIYGE